MQWDFAEKLIWLHLLIESPDLNPIENILGAMKQVIRSEYKQQTLPQTWESNSIKWFWGMKLTQEVCEWYVPAGVVWGRTNWILKLCLIIMYFYLCFKYHLII